MEDKEGAQQLCVCVCVCVRERERERDGKRGGDGLTDSMMEQFDRSVCICSELILRRSC